MFVPIFVALGAQLRVGSYTFHTTIPGLVTYSKKNGKRKDALQVGT